MNYKTSLLILLLSLGVFNAAYAQEDEPVIFEDIDTDHNGAISHDEAKVRKDLVKNFDEIDKNDNGSLSVDEYTAYHNKGRMIPEEVEIPEPGSAPVR
jgi:hypothetical protein